MDVVLNMTDEMLALARENQRKAGVENAEFLGHAHYEQKADATLDCCVAQAAQVPDRCEAGLLTGNAAEGFTGHTIRLRDVYRFSLKA